MGTYSIQDTPEGSKTLLYRNGGDIRLHSAYAPIREAERAAQTFAIGRANFIVVLGCALGYHVAALHARFPGHRMLVVERDPEVVTLCRTITPAVGDASAIVTSGQELSSFMESFDLSSFRGARFYTHRPSYQLDPAFYDGYVRDINQYFSSKLSDLLTRFEFEGRWVENIIANLHHLDTAHPVLDLFGRFSGYPGVIVSAGPSLRRSLPGLPALRQRAFVVAVDTAFSVMRRSGIEPHVVMTLDSQKHSLKHFLGHADSPAPLIADIVSLPRILDYYRGPLIMSSTAKYYQDGTGALQRELTPFMDWVEGHVASFGDIQSGGSIATNAFDLLLNSGCKPIILIGQDLAYTGREIHCSGTHHNDGWLPITGRFMTLDTINQKVIRKRSIKYVESFGGNGTVITDFVFDLYRSWFVDSANKVPFDVINATEGGARIPATREASLDQLIRELPVLKPSPDEIMSDILSRRGGRDLDRLRAAVGDARQRIDFILSLLEEKRASIPDDVARRIEEQVNHPSIRQMYLPFLKKTNTYLSRNPEIDPERSQSLMLADIITSSKKLKKLLSRCKL